MRRVLVAALAAASLLAPAAGASWWSGMPDALTPRGQLIEELYDWIFLAALFFFLLVFVLLVYILVRFREGSGHGRATHEKHRHSTFGETVWTVGPLIVVLIVGFAAWQGMQVLDYQDHPDSADMRVKITGSQWNWRADYGEGVVVDSQPDQGNVAEANQFWLPAGKKVAFEITSTDVIHAFHVADANRATVALMDANPTGPHKVNPLVLEFQEGEYPVQCREMCLNPGHAYMRAHIHVVSQEDFDRWFEQKKLAAGADFVTQVAFTIDGNGIGTTAPLQLASGARFLGAVENKAQEAHTVSVNGDEVLTVQPGDERLFAINITMPGPYNVTSSAGGSLGFTVFEATVIDVELGNYRFEPQRLELTKGTNYLFQLRNTHNAPHNLYIGDHPGTLLAQSPTLFPGESGSLLFTPEESGDFEFWCAIPGHYELGMHGPAKIA